MTNSDFNQIDNNAIFFKRFQRNSFACIIAKFAKLFAYCFIGLHVASMLLEAISPFSINPPDIFFQLLFLLILWGIVEFISIPIETCTDNCIFDYQHHWISFYQNRFFYNKTTIIANFNQLISIGITCRPRNFYSSVFKSSDKRYAIVIQDFSSKLIRITDYNLDLMEANNFCKNFCEKHLPGTKFYEGQEGMELALDPNTGLISVLPAKSTSLNLIDSITVPTFQALIAILLTYFMFNTSFYFINFSSKFIFNTDIKIYNQPVMQLIAGLENVIQEKLPSSLDEIDETSHEETFVKVKVSVPTKNISESTNFPTLDLKNHKIIDSQLVASTSVITKDKIVNAISTTTNNIADVSSSTNEIEYKTPATNVVTNISTPLINTNIDNKIHAEANININNENEPSVNTKNVENIVKNVVTYAEEGGIDDVDHIKHVNTPINKVPTLNINPELINSKIPSYDNENKLSSTLGSPIQENEIPSIDINVISTNLNSQHSSENNEKILENTDTTGNSNIRIPSIQLSQLPNNNMKIDNLIKDPKMISPDKKHIKDVDKTINEEDIRIANSDIKNIKPIQTIKLLQNRIRNVAKSSSKKNTSCAILPGYGLGKLANLQELAATCINKLGTPLVKYKAKDSWQLIYSNFTLKTTIKKLEQIKSITITKRKSEKYGLIATPQGVSVGSPISLVAEKYGPSTLIDGSPSFHFPSLGVTFIPSGTNDKIVGAIEIYAAKSK